LLGRPPFGRDTKRRSDKTVDDENCELIKGNIFSAAISMIGGNIFDSIKAVVITIVSGFPSPDEGKMPDERSWLPQHFALAIGVRNKISEDNIRNMLSVDPLPGQRLSKREGDTVIICDESSLYALHLVAQYSESLELLEDILQIDHNITKMVSESEDIGEETTLLGFLCRRCHFPAFDAMVLTLTEVDSSVYSIFDHMSIAFIKIFHLGLEVKRV
jgi:hypothetical protein